MVREIYDTGAFFSEAFENLETKLSLNSSLLSLASQFQFDRANCLFQGVYGSESPDPKNIYSLLAADSNQNNYICSPSEDFDCLMGLLDLCLDKETLPSQATAEVATAKLLKICFEERAFQTKPLSLSTIFKCEKPLAPEGADSLQVIQAEKPHLKAVSRWVHNFMAEMYPQKNSQEESQRIAESEIRGGRLFLLHNNKVVLGMASWTRPTPGGVGLDLIYVPPQERGKGYGKAISYLLADKMINDEGYREVNLFLKDRPGPQESLPTSLGFQEVGMFEQFLVIPPY